MEIVQELLPVQIERTAPEMKGDMRQAARIIGKGTSALAREFYRALEPFVDRIELRNVLTGPFEKGTTFFS